MLLNAGRREGCSRPFMLSRCSANQETQTRWRTRRRPIRRQRRWVVTSDCEEVPDYSATPQTVQLRWVLTNVWIIFGSETDPIHITNTYLVRLVGTTFGLFKKAQGSVVSNGSWVKLGRIVLQVNTHRLTESDFWYFWRWQPWRYFTKKFLHLKSYCANWPDCSSNYLDLDYQWCTEKFFLLSVL